MLIWIAIGGAVGSVTRHILGGAAQRATHISFPVGTLAVNVLGCFIIGVLTQHYMNTQLSPLIRAALITGFCGGFTTFSAFSIETVALVESGSYARAAAYIVISVILSIGATFAGMTASRAVAA